MPGGRRYRPPMAERPLADTFLRLVDIMARLRSPGGCPWDREQTPESLRPYVIEEAYEVLEAIERDDPDALRDELGDLLLQVVFQAQLAAEAGRFTITDVARARRVEAAARARGAALTDLDPAERERLWALAKEHGAHGANADDAGPV